MMLLLIAALFLPLFPLSIVFNGVLGWLRLSLARALLLLLWPQIGLLVLQASGSTVPQAFVAWALLSSGFYGLRLLSTRDLSIWTGFLASSSLALGWILAADQASMIEQQLFVFAFSLPAAMLNLFVGPLTKRFGAAYAGLPGGLAGVSPRLSGMLIVTTLAAIATPPFPGFFAMLSLLQGGAPGTALAALLIWLVWTWAATRLVQGFVVGVAPLLAVDDMDRSSLLVYAILLIAFTVAGLYLIGSAL